MKTDVNNKNAEIGNVDKFFNIFEKCLLEGTFVKLILGKYCGEEIDLEKIFIKQLTIKDEECLSFVFRYKTNDITKNYPNSIAIEKIKKLFGNSFKNIHLLTFTKNVQLTCSKKGKWLLNIGKANNTIVAVKEHNKDKNRYLDLNRPFLTELGVTDKQCQLIPSMSRKWKQINKFLEVFNNAFESSKLSDLDNIDVVDFGSGKGYLTFAIHDYLFHSLKKDTQVTGVELRDNLVKLCNDAIAKLNIKGLSIRQGDVRNYTPEKINVMIALHACDIATDYAIHMGIRSDADIIMCSPCCHKQLRPQLEAPSIMIPMLKYGVHMGQEAEMVTDSLRALLLEANGYTTQVFEFISLEHTSKNKMILAVKHSRAVKKEEILSQVQSIKNHYGITEHCLEVLLNS